MLSELISGRLDFVNAIIYILSTVLVVFLTLPVHEFAHGFVAVKLGDNTPKWQHRLTLNPFAHIDYLGSLCILLFGFGWAKPVSVNARNFDNPKMGMAIVAFAGPLSNIVMSILALLLGNVFLLLSITVAELFVYAYYILFYLAQINISLAVFNLLPIPPLDGSRLLFAFLPDKYYFKVMQYERFIFFGLMILLYVGVLDGPISLLSGKLMGFVYNIAYLPFKLFGY